METQKGNTVYLAVGVILLLLVLYFVFRLVSASLDFLSSINWSDVDSTVVAAVITATLGFLASVIAVIIGGNLSKKREIEFQNRTKKSEAYSKFVEDILSTLVSKDLSDQDKEKMYEKIAKDFGRDLVLWGSDEAIKAYKDFRELGKRGDVGVEIVFALEKVLLAIRKDLGHRNNGLTPATLLSFFMKESSSEMNNLKNAAK